MDRSGLLRRDNLFEHPRICGNITPNGRGHEMAWALNTDRKLNFRQGTPPMFLSCRDPSFLPNFTTWDNGSATSRMAARP
eukprot:12934874-Prorocentrum_lima.AAC.1